MNKFKTALIGADAVGTASLSIARCAVQYNRTERIRTAYRNTWKADLTW